MTAWLIRLRDRPIAEGERRRAFIASTVLLTLTVALLALTTPATRTTTATDRSALAGHMLAGQPQASPVPVSADGQSTPGALSPPVSRVARRFLAGYLAYVYGHGGVAGVHAASPTLVRSLGANPPRVSIDIRARHPHVIALQATAAPAGQAGVSALVNDGGVADYPVVLFISERGGRLLVTSLGAA
jgi:hypothetical protein